MTPWPLSAPEVSKPAVTAPTEQEIEDAEIAMIKASSDARVGAEVRRMKQAKTECQVRQQNADAAEAEAKTIRAAAGKIDEVLSNAVKADGLFVKSGRLLTTTGRGETYFGELSKGERWALAFRLVNQAFGDGGVVVLPQECWEGLDPANRAMVAKIAREHRIVVITALADGGELRAEEVAS